MKQPADLQAADPHTVSDLGGRAAGNLHMLPEDDLLLDRVMSSRCHFSEWRKKTFS